MATHRARACAPVQSCIVPATLPNQNSGKTATRRLLKKEKLYKQGLVFYPDNIN
jgi:hypothetical protein